MSSWSSALNLSIVDDGILINCAFSEFDDVAGQVEGSGYVGWVAHEILVPLD